MLGILVADIQVILYVYQFHFSIFFFIKKSPCTSSIVQVIFPFWPFEISEDILRNQKFVIGLDSFSCLIIWSHYDITSFCIDYPVLTCKISVILFGFMLPNLKGH